MTVDRKVLAETFGEIRSQNLEHFRDVSVVRPMMRIEVYNMSKLQIRLNDFASV